MRKNKDIRVYAINKGVYLWEIAEEIGILDASLSRKLRNELPQNEKEQLFSVIDAIANKHTKVEAEQNTAAQITSA